MTGQVIAQETEMPGGAFEDPLSSGEPRSGKGVKPLLDAGKGAEVMASGLNAPKEGTVPGSAEHAKHPRDAHIQ